jgi:AraC-like DNA-binding protein
MDQALNELRAIVMRANDTWTATGIPRVEMVRAEACSNQVYAPMLHLVLQGSKELLVGEQVLNLGPATYFVAPVDVPAIGQVQAERRGSPYLAMSLTLKPDILAAILADIDTHPRLPTLSFSVSTAPAELIDACLRMMRLMDRPDEVAVLAPLIEREILFRILQGPQGTMLRHIARDDGRLSQVRRAIDWIRAHYTEPFRVEPLAAIAGMSVAVFYRHFKAITAMTPIQYQKRLRLLKARRQLIFGPRDAAAVAFSVGYESASQFSREYARMYGLPPARDMARLKAPGYALSTATPSAHQQTAQAAAAP